MLSSYYLLLRFLGLDVEKMTFYKVPFEAGKRYQFATVPAGATMVVYAFRNWGQDFKAFIRRIGFGPDTLPWDLVNFIWEIDGETVEVFNYQIASVKKPKQFREPFIAKKEIVWKVVNNDVNPHVCEVLCDGMLVMKPKAKVRYGV